MFGALGRLGLALMLAAAAWPACANVVVTGTRVIYPAGLREQTVRLTNRGDAPVLVQAWIDEDERNDIPAKARSPFLLTPAVFRLDPEKGQSLRIRLIQEHLPTDRESVYWLNVLEVPVKPQFTNYLQMSIRTRLKLFYRPGGLLVQPDELGNKLIWHVKKENGKTYIECRNPTALNASLTELDVLAGAQRVRVDADMVAPFSSRRWPLETQSAPTLLKFGLVNDFGAVVGLEAVIGQ
ncbi:fimbria/pilus periplasmic chaperone [Jeongeupia wiesaeckerbachi]|uniref:fimbrial biogenesis chaperone n=1 Tax=Jeongeupia wiesaeckerbachi TaxID=3051218 RepID=UPI003D8089D9